MAIGVLAEVEVGSRVVLQSMLPEVAGDEMLVQLWLADIRASRSGSEMTQRAYNRETRRFRAIVGKSFPEITYRDLVAFSTHLDEGLHLAKASRARALAAVRSLFSFASKMGYLHGANPASLVHPPRVTAISKRTPLGPDEVRVLLAAARRRSGKAFAIVATLATIGLRVSEATSLRWCDLFEDLNGNTGVRIVGKGDKLREVKVRPDLLAVLRRLRAAEGRSTELDPNDETALFRNRDGRHLSEVYVRRLVGELAVQAGIRKTVTPHVLRHSFATLALLHGADCCG